MKLAVFIFFTGSFGLLSLFANCQNNNSKDVSNADYFLTGSIKGIDTGWLYIKDRQTGKIDSAIIENGKFMIAGKTETPDFCNIGTGSSGKRDFYFGFFLAACKMTLEANKDSHFDAAIDIQGYYAQDEFKQFQKQMRTIDVVSNEVWSAEKNTFKSRQSLIKAKGTGQKKKRDNLEFCR